MTVKKFQYCFYATAEASAMIFLIFLGADLMNAALALTQVPAQLAQLVQGWGLSPFMVVAAIAEPMPKLRIVMSSAVAESIGRSRPITGTPKRSANIST